MCAEDQGDTPTRREPDDHAGGRGHGGVQDTHRQPPLNDDTAAYDVAPTAIVSKLATRVVGPYKLLQQIGHGGMGSVWMAEQEEPVRRRVALKLIREEVDSQEAIARFAAERQALAIMDHQNIAKVLDAGTTETGAPFFVMELVKGVPITEYCDNNRLSVRERVSLMVQVCKATQHAHQKGIIHRDLKPSNVLVTPYDGKPVPKVIDFGLAKALEHTTHLTDKTMFTEFGKVVGTVQYMSPEQAELNALDVDTRTDVYSLGVMLYELLTGTTPLDKQTLGSNAFLKVLELIREKDPLRPSSRLESSTNSVVVCEKRGTSPTKLGHQLRGELDWIVMKALEKDRNRRYQTAKGLSDDLERFLDNEPILARPPSTLYRICKFARRQRSHIISSVIVLLLIAISLGLADQVRRAWLIADQTQQVRMHEHALEGIPRQPSLPSGELQEILACLDRLRELDAGESQGTRAEEIAELLEKLADLVKRKTDWSEEDLNRVLETIATAIGHPKSGNRFISR